MTTNTKEFNPMAVRIPVSLTLAANDNTIVPGVSNGGPPLDDEPQPTPFELLVIELDDLFDEAKNFCDGAAIDSDELAEAITTLQRAYSRSRLAMKRAEARRARAQADAHAVAGQQSGVTTLHQERTPEDGVIRLERWPEGYVLWHHGSVVWRSFRR